MPIKSFILKWDEPLGVALIAAIFAACLAENLYAVSTLMDTSVGTYIQYSVAVMIEALGLIKMREAFRNRKWAATGGMLLLTVLAVANSVANELTFYNVNYANKSQSAIRQAGIATDLGKEKAEIEARLTANSNVRPVAAIEADIALALSKEVVVSRRRSDTLGRLTRDCMDKRADYYDRGGGFWRCAANSPTRSKFCRRSPRILHASKSSVRPASGCRASA